MKKCEPESMETPAMEAKTHGKAFMEKAAKLSSRKMGGTKHEKKAKGEKKSAKKRA